MTLPLALIPIVVTATLVVWALIFPLVILFLLVWGLVFFPADVVSGIGELMSALATRVGADILSMMPLLAIALPLAAPSLVVTLFVGGGRRRKLRPPVPVDRWIEYYSPLDPVSLGTRSGNHATVVRVVNLRGRNIFTEHSSYFANDVHVLPDLCERLGSWMSLRLPGNRDAAPFSLRRRITTRLVLAAPSIVTLLAFIAGRHLHIW